MNLKVTVHDDWEGSDFNNWINNIHDHVKKSRLGSCQCKPKKLKNGNKKSV